MRENLSHEAKTDAGCSGADARLNSKRAVGMTFRRLIGDAITLRFVGRRWQMPCFALLGVLAGLGLFLVPVSRAPSYLGDEPETCIHCHVMTTQFVTWQHSSHVEAATCNDCHVPHDDFLSKYAFKAQDGLWHATVFTMRWEPQVIRLSDRAIPVVEENCRRCHAEVIGDVSIAEHESGDLRCWDCHREVPHGRVRSLSAASDVFRPQLGPIGSVDSEPRIRGRSVRSTRGDRP